jgi:hypothetical protein
MNRSKVTTHILKNLVQNVKTTRACHMTGILFLHPAQWEHVCFLVGPAALCNMTLLRNHWSCCKLWGMWTRKEQCALGEIWVNTNQMTDTISSTWPNTTLTKGFCRHPNSAHEEKWAQTYRRTMGCSYLEETVSVGRQVVLRLTGWYQWLVMCELVQPPPCEEGLSGLDDGRGKPFNDASGQCLFGERYLRVSSPCFNTSALHAVILPNSVKYPSPILAK